MKCYYHNKKNSVSECGQCGKFLCNECSDQFKYNGRIICKDCANEINDHMSEGEEKEKKNIKRNLILISILWLLLLIGISIPQIGSLFGLYFVFLIIYLRKNIPLPPVLVNGGRMVWLIVFFIYISWGILYLFFIYPIRYGKELFKKENRKILKILGGLLILSLIILLVNGVENINKNSIGEQSDKLKQSNTNPVKKNEIIEENYEKIITNFKESIKLEKDFKYFKNVELVKVEFFLKGAGFKELKTYTGVKYYEYEIKIGPRLLFSFFEKNDEKGNKISFDYVKEFNLNGEKSNLYKVNGGEENIYGYIVISNKYLYILDK